MITPEIIYQKIYDAVLAAEQCRLEPLTKEQLSVGLKINLDGPWVTEKHPEILAAIKQAQFDVSEQRRLW